MTAEKAHGRAPATPDRRRHAEFAQGTSRWLVAVRMVSEGVGVPGFRSGFTPQRLPRRCSSHGPSRSGQDSPTRRARAEGNEALVTQSFIGRQRAQAIP